MDNFKVIYKILKTLEKSMDYEEFDTKLISSEALDITRERWNAIMKMLLGNGYIEGAEAVKYIGAAEIKLNWPEITLKGLEYLSENSMMKKMAALAKGVAEIVM